MEIAGWHQLSKIVIGLHLVPEVGFEFFLEDESRLKLLVHTSPPSVEVIDVDEAGVSPRLFVKLQDKRKQIKILEATIADHLIKHAISSYLA